MTSRRQFVRQVSGAALAAAVAPGAALAVAVPVREAACNELSLAGFLRHVGSAFRIRAEDGATVVLRLQEATETQFKHRQDGKAADAGHEKFSLIFRGSNKYVLDQRIHLFEHPEMGGFAMFIVPVFSRDTEGRYYQAIFNRPATLKTRSDRMTSTLHPDPSGIVLTNCQPKKG